MIHQHVTLEDTVYFWVGTNDTTGSGADLDSGDLDWDVRLAGAAADAAPVLSGTGSLLSHANYPPGCMEIAVAATDGNGFAAGDTYAVFATGLVDSKNPTGFVGSFKLGPIPADITHWAGTAIASAISAANLALLEDMLDGTGATLTLDKLVVDADDPNGAVDIDNAGGPGITIEGIQGISILSSGGVGFAIDADYEGVQITGGNGFDGIRLAGTGDGHGLGAYGGATGHGIYALGGDTSGDGINATAQTDGDGITAVGAGASQYDINADIHGTIDTCTTNSDMRGTDNAALASVLGALDDAAADGDPTDADTALAYLKQLINTLEGTAGMPSFPTEAAPGDNVSLAEAIRAIHADVTGLNGDPMRGTDSAATAAKLLAYVQLLARSDAAIAADAATELGEINANEGSGAGSYDNTTDSLEAGQAEHDATQTAVGNLEDLSQAEVQAACTASLVAHNLDHLCLTATVAADMTTEVADNTVLSRLLANGDTSAFDPSTDGLQPIRDRGDAAWITATSTAVSDKTGFSLTAAYDPAKTAAQAGDAMTLEDAAITAAKFAADAIAAAAVAAAAANKIADHVRRRTQANVEASEDGDALAVGSEYGLIQQAQKSAVAASTQTVKKTDGSTLGTLPVTSDADADPVTGVGS